MSARKQYLDAAALAASQHGNVSLSQLDRSAVEALLRRARAGEFERQAHGVYAPASAVRSWKHDLTAALLAHPGAVASHRSAGALHRWSGFPEGPVELSGSYSANTRSLGLVHRTNDLIACDVMTIEGIAVTTPLRTAIDMSAVLRRRRLEWLLDELLAANAFTLPELEQAFRRIARRGKPGMANLRWFVEGRGPGYVPPSSRLERKLSDVLEGLGVEPPVRQHPLPGAGGPGRVDLCFTVEKVIAEGDSRRWHQREADMANDRKRDADAAAVGWLTLRFTWKQLTEQPDWVRATVARTLRSRCSGVRNPHTTATSS